MDLPPHKYIATAPDWQACLNQLQSQTQIALDLEANSMYAYREQVCLIQISIPGQDFIVDPLTPLNLKPLGDMIENPNIEKIFHAAEYDLTLLKRQFDWQLNNLFDTMWAARILGYQRYGLANMLEQLYDVKLNKRYQKSNWCKRPLIKNQLTYAQLDTHFLLKLRADLSHQLEAKNHLDEAQIIFKEQCHVTPHDATFDPDSFWSIGRTQDLSHQQQAILKELHIFRNQQACKRDQPLFKIFNDRTLIELTKTAPTGLSQLRQIHGMSSGQIRRYGRSLIDIIRNAKHLPPPPFPKRPKRPPEQVTQRYDKLHYWRKIRAQERGVESDVIISRDALWRIAKHNPQNIDELANIEMVGEWRCQEYGKEILKILQNSHYQNGNP
ncbi:MAG: hypothetical protein DWQ04_01805 [Chloroflexi bacterium]|nr:MAG: hypothetical protein DWQ04_01805 [Chloroflexota bacterium]